MNIPLLGNLFKSKSSQKDRKELMVLMRPKVLKTPEIAAQATTEQKKTLPGILRAEAELKTEENRQLDEDKKIMEDENRRNAKRKKSAAKDPAVQEAAPQKPVSAADDSIYTKPANSAADDSFYAKPKTSANPL
jgi:type II secretory pathway component GspD/PulD (secretin)